MRTRGRFGLARGVTVFGAVLALGVLGSGDSGAAADRLADLPANTWVDLGSSEAAIAPLIWLPETGRGLVWPALNYGSRLISFDQYRDLRLFDPAAGQWTTTPSTFPKAGNPAPYGAGRPCVYLPGLKRVLLLGEAAQGVSLKANSWLLDPSTNGWEAVEGDLRMTDRSADFNPVSAMDGRPVPVMGALAYDAENREAVAVGGAEVWGRVEATTEPVRVGDWIYDETLSPKRTRRLVSTDAGRARNARRWHPGHCGTWLFSEATRQWRPLEQRLSEQPGGRLFPGLAYDAGERTIVFFGGDDESRCLGDTWLYDCASRRWKQAAPKVSPPPRACPAMVYLPDRKAVLMAGGYGTGWTVQTDVWLYETAKDAWSRLGVDLPAPVGYAWGAWEPERRAVLVRAIVKTTFRPSESRVYALRLDPATAPKPAGEVDPGFDYHCRSPQERQPTPEEWRSPANKPSDPDAVRKELAALPANTWVLRRPPMKAIERRWGQYVYDERTHRGYAWGGGHGGYMGNDVSEYDLLRNRWSGMVDPPEFKPRWRHKSSGDAPPGRTFGGSILIQSHARKSYEVDPLTNSIVTSHGDVYSIAERRFVGSIGPCPGKWGWGDQVVYVATPHGLYAYTSGGQVEGRQTGALCRANVAAGGWDLVATGGPENHSEHNPLCYDRRRDGLLYFRAQGGEVWRFGFTGAAWTREEPVGPSPKTVGGDPAYVDPLDAALFVYAPDRDADTKLYLYVAGERRWYTAPYAGDRGGNPGRLSNSTFWDPDLGLAVRLASSTQSLDVLVMRLDPKALALTPLAAPESAERP